MNTAEMDATVEVMDLLELEDRKHRADHEDDLRKAQNLEILNKIVKDYERHVCVIKGAFSM